MEEGQSEPGLGEFVDGATVGLPEPGRGVSDAEHKARPAEALQTMQSETEQETIQREAGRLRGLLAPGILQSLLHGIAPCQRCAVKRSVSPESQEDAWPVLRELWGYEDACSASHRRELEEQLANEHPDVMRVMSCYTPPPCQTCWSDGSWEDGVPRVSTGVPDRANKLKALGNGLVWQIPYAIGKSIMDQT
jgi:hypothetical protein